MTSEPRYIKVYYNRADALFTLTTNQMSLLTMMMYVYREWDDTCIVILDEHTKKFIMARLNWNETSFNNALRGLKKAGIVIRENKELYVLNPDIFGIMDGQEE